VTDAAFPSPRILSLTHLAIHLQQTNPYHSPTPPSQKKRHRTFSTELSRGSQSHTRGYCNIACCAGGARIGQPSPGRTNMLQMRGSRLVQGQTAHLLSPTLQIRVTIEGAFIGRTAWSEDVVFGLPRHKWRVSVGYSLLGWLRGQWAR
jgi:hypothetical protein